MINRRRKASASPVAYENSIKTSIPLWIGVVLYLALIISIRYGPQLRFSALKTPRKPLTWGSKTRKSKCCSTWKFSKTMSWSRSAFGLIKSSNGDFDYLNEPTSCRLVRSSFVCNRGIRSDVANNQRSRGLFATDFEIWIVDKGGGAQPRGTGIAHGDSCRNVGSLFFSSWLG